MAHILVLIASLSVAAPTPATKRDELKALVTSLATTPADDAARRKIISLALTLKPAPQLPEEAERRMVRGGAAMKGAKDSVGWKTAAREFEAATLAAPWWGDAYYNLAVAQDKSGEYALALRTLALAELALPTSKDVKKFRYEVEFRRDEAASPEARARAEEDWFKKLDGAVFVGQEEADGLIRLEGKTLVFFDKRMSSGVCLCQIAETARCRGPIGEELDCRRKPLTGKKYETWIGQDGLRVEIADDGESIIQKSYMGKPWEKVTSTRIFRRRR